MEYLFCGIDVSKDRLDYALCLGGEKKILDVSVVQNKVSGISQLIKLLRKSANDEKLWVCLENTGNYGLLLIHLLQNAGVTFSMVPSLDIIRSSGLTRGKTDPIDAQRIALYAATFAHKLKPTVLPGESILRIKSLLTVRDLYVRMRTQFKNAYKSLEITCRVVDMKKELTGYQMDVSNLDKKIRGIEKKMIEVISQDNELQKTYEKIIRVTGVGKITAASIILYTNNFNLFQDPRKFNCFCGLAPFEYSSGTSIKKRTRTSKYRNREMKKLLFNAANTAINYDQQIKTYYNRKTGEGKPKMAVINAVACKVVYRIFAAASRDEPFVKLSF